MNPWLWPVLIAARLGNREPVPMWGARLVGGPLVLAGALIGGAMLVLVVSVALVR